MIAAKSAHLQSYKLAPNDACLSNKFVGKLSPIFSSANNQFHSLKQTVSVIGILKNRSNMIIDSKK